MRYTVSIPGLTLFPGMGGQPDWARDLTADQILLAARKAEDCGFSHLVIPWHMAISRRDFEKNMGARWPHSLTAAGMLLAPLAAFWSRRWWSRLATIRSSSPKPWRRSTGCRGDAACR